MIITPSQARAFIRAAVDDKFGDGTSDMVDAVHTGDVSLSAIGQRFGISKQAVSQRVRRARTYTRRMLVAAGILPPHKSPKEYVSLAKTET